MPYANSTLYTYTLEAKSVIVAPSIVKSLNVAVVLAAKVKLTVYVKSVVPSSAVTLIVVALGNSVASD